MTVARLLADPKEQAQLAGQVLIVDEAGMVASKDMADMMRLAKERARGFLLGRHGATQERFGRRRTAVLERESQLRAFLCGKCNGRRMPNIKRRSNLSGTIRRRASRSSKPWARFARWIGGCVRRKSAKRTARPLWFPTAKAKRGRCWSLRPRMTKSTASRTPFEQDLKRTGDLKPGETFQKHAALNWTEAQKRSPKNYQPGQVLEFHKAVKGIAKE